MRRRVIWWYGGVPHEVGRPAPFVRVRPVLMGPRVAWGLRVNVALRARRAR